MPLGPLAKGYDYLSTLWKQCIHHQPYSWLQNVSNYELVMQILSHLWFMLYSDSMLSRNFSSTFTAFTLAEFLSNFSLPISLGDLKELFENEVNFRNITNIFFQEVIEMVVWLLQHKQIVQVCCLKYFWFIVNGSWCIAWSYCSCIRMCTLFLHRYMWVRQLPALLPPSLLAGEVNSLLMEWIESAIQLVQV